MSSVQVQADGYLGAAKLLRATVQAFVASASRLSMASALGALAPTPFNISYEVRPTRRHAAALRGSRHIKITALAR